MVIIVIPINDTENTISTADKLGLAEKLSLQGFDKEGDFKVKKDGKKFLIRESIIEKVAITIQKEDVTWSFLDKDLLKLFIRLAIRKYPTDEFNTLSEEELVVKIRKVFGESEDAKKLTPEDMLKISAVYRHGKQWGLKPKAFFKKITKYMDKNDTKE